MHVNRGAAAAAAVATLVASKNAARNSSPARSSNITLMNTSHSLTLDDTFTVSQPLLHGKLS